MLLFGSGQSTQGVSRAQPSTFPKGTVPKKGSAWYARVSAKQAARGAREEEDLGGRRKNSVPPLALQSQAAQSPCGVHCRQGRLGSRVLHESCLHPWLLMLTLVLPHQTAASEPVLTSSAEPASADALVMCQGAQLKHHRLGKGKPKSVNKQEIWWSRRLLNTDSCLVSIRRLKGNCLSKNHGSGHIPQIPSAQWQGRAEKLFFF